jgi:hypothetical protein
MLGIESLIRDPSAVANGSLQGGRKAREGWTIVDNRCKPANSLPGQRLPLGYDHQWSNASKEIVGRIEQVVERGASFLPPPDS